MTIVPRVRQLAELSDSETLTALSDILLDCVEGGASVSFMSPLSRERAEAFWRGRAASIAAGDSALLVAENDHGEIIGTVQVILTQPENQPHRADVAKLLVHRKGRNTGTGTALMTAAQELAKRAGKTLLVLDTATGGDAERLYTRLGWQLSGIIPDYALWPGGGLTPTSVFYKHL